MSELTLFVIGTIVFAITVYGSVIGGGLLMARQLEVEEAIPSPGDNLPAPSKPDAT